jgi:hypothetical protein
MTAPRPARGQGAWKRYDELPFVAANDAVCSSADETHDAMVEIYRDRFQMQVEAANTEVILRAWK